MLTTVESVEELDSRHQLGVDGESGVNQENAHNSCQTISKQLRTDQCKDTNRHVRADVVVQVLSGENADGQGG